MLRKLKDLFNSKPREVSVTMDELPTFIKDSIKAEKKEARGSLEPKMSRIDSLSAKAARQLDSLETAQLQNKKIPTRALQIMKGNREAYIKHTRLFLDRLDTEAEPQEFVHHFEKDLERLSSANSRPSMVLNEFFSKETSDVARTIKEMVDTVEEIRKLKQSESRFVPLQKIMEELNSARSALKDKNSSKKALEHDISENRNQQEKLRDQMKNLLESRDYSQVKKLSDAKKKAAVALEELENNLLQETGALDSMLRKYSRISLNPKIVKKFMEKPLLCISNDTEDLVEMLAGLAKSIESGSIDAKEKKSQKAREALESLDMNKIMQIKKDHDRLSEEVRESEEMLRKSAVMRDLDELEYQLNHLSQKQDQLNSRLSLLQSEIAKIDIDAISEKIRTSAMELGITVS